MHARQRGCGRGVLYLGSRHLCSIRWCLSLCVAGRDSGAHWTALHHSPRTTSLDLRGAPCQCAPEPPL